MKRKIKLKMRKIKPELRKISSSIIKAWNEKDEYTCEFKEQENIIAKAFDGKTNKLVEIMAVTINLYCNDKCIATLKNVLLNIETGKIFKKYGYNKKFNYSEIENIEIKGKLED